MGLTSCGLLASVTQHGRTNNSNGCQWVTSAWEILISQAETSLELAVIQDSSYLDLSSFLLCFFWKFLLLLLDFLKSSFSICFPLTPSNANVNVRILRLRCTWWDSNSGLFIDTDNESQRCKWDWTWQSYSVTEAGWSLDFLTHALARFPPHQNASTLQVTYWLKK